MRIEGKKSKLFHKDQLNLHRSRLNWPGRVWPSNTPFSRPVAMAEKHAKKVYIHKYYCYGWCQMIPHCDPSETPTISHLDALDNKSLPSGGQHSFFPVPKRPVTVTCYQLVASKIEVNYKV